MAADERVGILISAKNSASSTINTVKADLNKLGESAGSLTDLSSAFSGLGKAAGLVGAALSAIEVGKTVVELAQVGAQAQRVETSFDTLTRQAGIASDGLLASLQKSSQGTIANTELMLTSNRALVLGVADTTTEMSQLMDVAIARGKLLGLSAQQAFSDLVTGIGRMSPLILDNLGIITGGEKVFADYAKSIGRSSDSLTDMERKQALVNKVIAESKDLVAANAAAGVDAAASFERISAAFTNLKTDLGELFGPAIAAFAEKLAVAVDSATNAVKSGGGTLQIDAALGNVQAAQQSVQQLGSDLAQAKQFLSEMTVGTEAYKEQQELVNRLQGDFSGQQRELTDAQRAYFDVLRQIHPAQAQTAESINRTSAEAMHAADAMRIAGVEARALAATETPAFTRIDYGTLVSDTQTLVTELARGTITTNEFASLLANLSGATSTLSTQASGTVDQIRQLSEGFLSGQVSEEQLRTGIEALTGSTFTLQEAIGALASTYPAAAQNALQLANANKIAAASVDEIIGKFSGLNAIASQVVIAADAQTGVKFLNDMTTAAEEQVIAWQEAGFSQKEIVNVLLPAYQQQIRKSAEETFVFGAAATKANKQAQQAVKELNQEYEGLKSKVGGVLSQAFNDIGGVDLDKILPRQDAVNEDARRLADVAVKGFDSPWAEYFRTKFPDLFAELTAGGDVKIAAAQILRDFQDGLRPELLDKGRAKELVRRAILGEQTTKALIDEISKELATELGISVAEAQRSATQALGIASDKKEQTITFTPQIDRSQLGNQEISLTGRVTSVAFGDAVLTRIDLTATVTAVTLAEEIALPLPHSILTLDSIVMAEGVTPPSPVIAGGMTIVDVGLRSDVQIPKVELVTSIVVVPPDTTSITNTVLVLSAIVSTVTLDATVTLPILQTGIVIDGIVIGTGVTPPSVLGSMVIDNVRLAVATEIPEVDLNVGDQTVSLSAVVTTAQLADDLALPTLQTGIIASSVVVGTETIIPTISVTGDMLVDSVTLRADVQIPMVETTATVTVLPPDTLFITEQPLFLTAVVSHIEIEKSLTLPVPQSSLEITAFLLSSNATVPVPPVSSNLTIDAVVLRGDVQIPTVELSATVAVTPPDTTPISDKVLVLSALVRSVALDPTAALPVLQTQMQVTAILLAEGVTAPVPSIVGGLTIDSVSLASDVVMPTVELAATTNLALPDIAPVEALRPHLTADVSIDWLSAITDVAPDTLRQQLAIIVPVSIDWLSVDTESAKEGLLQRLSLPIAPNVSFDNLDTETPLDYLQTQLTPVVVPTIDYLNIPFEDLAAAGIWIATGIQTGITTFNLGNAIVAELGKAQSALLSQGVVSGQTWGSGFNAGASDYITGIVSTVVTLALAQLSRNATRTGAQ